MIKLSASAIGTYEKCPRQYSYRYIEKPEIEVKEWAHLELGSCAHRVLEIFHETMIKAPVPPDQFSGLMSKCFSEALKEFKPHLIKPNLPELKEMIQGYLNSIRLNGMPPTIAVEMPFNFNVGPYALKGFIDRLDRISETEFKIVDYKTSKNPNYLTDFQLLVYAAAVRREYPEAKKFSGAYVLLKHGSKTKDFDFSLSDIDKCLNKIEKVGVTIESDTIFEKKPTRLCDWCDFKAICQNSWDR